MWYFKIVLEICTLLGDEFNDLNPYINVFSIVNVQ